MNNIISYKGKEYFVTYGIGVALVPVQEIARIKVIDDNKVYDVTLFDNQEAVVTTVNDLSLPGRLRRHHIHTLKDTTTPSYSVNDDGSVMFFKSLEEAENYCSLHPNCIVINCDGDPVAYTL